MKNLKKLVSVILTVAMLISSIAVVGAAEYNDVDATNSYYKAVKVLSGLGIVKGDDEGNFNPTSDIKRSEMIALVCRMMGEDSIATATSVAFDDVADNHWAVSYIKWGVDSDIIKGVGDNKFAPDASVTYQDALVMILRALGYERIALRSENGGYPGGYVKVAKRYGVSEDITFANEKAATREVIAQAIYNALTTGIVETSSYANDPDDDKYTIYDGSSVSAPLKTVLTAYNKIYKVRATVDNSVKTHSTPGTLDKDPANPQVALTIQGALNDQYGYDLSSVFATTTINPYLGETDLDEYVGYTVDAYLVKNLDGSFKLVAGVVDVASIDTETVSDNYVTVTSQTADGASNTGYTYEYRVDINDARTTKIEIDAFSTIAVYYNGKALPNTAYDQAGELNTLFTNANEVTFVGPKGLDYTKVFITDYAYEQVKAVRAADKYIKLATGGLSLDAEARGNEKFTYNLYDAEGNTIALEDISENDILNIVAPIHTSQGFNRATAPYMDIYVTSNAVTGSVDEIKGSGATARYTIAGNEYKSTSVLSATEEGTFYITIDGVVAFKEAAVSTSKDFGFLLGVQSKADFGTETKYVRMWTTDGTVANYTLASSVKVILASGVEVDYRRGATTGSQQPQANLISNGAAPYSGTLAAKVASVVSTDHTSGTKATAKAAAETALAGRLFTYKLNAEGEITNMVFANGTNAEIAQTNNGSAKYNEDIFTFGNADLDDESKLILAPVSSVARNGAAACGTAHTHTDDCFKLEYNVDEEDLELLSFKSMDEDAVGIVADLFTIKNSDFLSAAIIRNPIDAGIFKTHFAVVTETGTAVDAAGQPVQSLTMLQSGEEVALKVKEELGTTVAAAGDIIQYQVNAAGEIENVNVVYDASAGSNRLDDSTYALAASGAPANKVAFVGGIITKIDGDKITLAAGTITDANSDGVLEGTGTTTGVRKINETEGNTYASFKTDAARKQDYKLIDAGLLSESYGDVIYAAVAMVNDDNRIEDVVMIEIARPTTAGAFTNTIVVDAQAWVTAL